MEHEGNIISAGADLLQKYDTLFGISKNVARAIPNIRDGLKPVQRKILFTMNEIGKHDDAKKVGSIVGEVLKIYSHGDASVIDALVRMATTWGNIANYIIGIGNFGCHSDDTEILTSTGWIPIKFISKRTTFITMNMEDNRPYSSMATNIYAYPYTGKMYVGIDRKSGKEGFKVTPNHRMIIKDEKEFVFAGDINSEYVTVPTLASMFECDWLDVDIKTCSYMGYVYCAEVPPFHTLITRRNGQILISGNSVMGTEHAAPRYIEAKLSPFARQCFFTDKLCIDMIPTYDNTRLEPETLPSMFPTAIINGATGSGFGASCNIPQYNLKDVIETTIKLIDNPQAKVKLIPDSHWGCDIMTSKPFGKYKTSFDQIFETGYGSYIQRFRYQIDHEKNIVIVTALPAKVNLEEILKEIERLQNENKAFPELKSMADLSGKDHDDGIWVEFKLFEGKNPYRFISKLESVKDMKKTVKVNVDLVDGLDVNHYSIRSYILGWYQYRHDYIRACLATELTNIDSDIAINDIKLFIFDEDRLEKTTDIYVSSIDTNDIIRKLMKEYSESTGLTSQQAMILANMSGKDYTKTALKKYKELKVTLQSEHDRLEKILVDPNGINNIIKQQLKSGLKFATPRGSKIIGQEDAGTDDKFVLAIQPANGTIVKLIDDENSQKLIDILPSNLCTQIDSNDNAIIFDNMGRYMIVNPGELPLMKDLSSMVPLNRYIDKPLKNLIAMEPLDETCRSFIVITKLGKIKKINPRNYRNRVSNNCYIGLDNNDEVVSVIGVKNENSHIIVYTNNGNAQRFHASIINVTGQTALGSYGIATPDNDTIAGGFCINGSDLVAYITKHGYMRINNSKYFPVRKNKKDWVHLIDMKGADKLAAIVPCTSNDILHVVYSNLTSENIPVKTINIDTMSQPPRPIAHKAKLTVVNVKRIQAKKK